MANHLFSVSNLHTYSQASLAVFLIVEVVKKIPWLSKIPTRLISVIVGELLFFLLIPSWPISRAEWLITLLNGFWVGTSAIGGWHLIQAAAHTKRRG